MRFVRKLLFGQGLAAWLSIVVGSQGGGLNAFLCLSQKLLFVVSDLIVSHLRPSFAFGPLRNCAGPTALCWRSQTTRQCGGGSTCAGVSCLST